jgi:uncharacterized protein (TIGR03435 family)
MRLAKFVVPAAVAIIACSDVAAQDGSGSSEPRFEVTSVKPVKDRVLRGYRPTPRQFTGQMFLIDFIALAYRVSNSRIIGGESVLRDIFSISGTIPADGKGRWGPMLRNLLEERFALKVHRETQDMPVYVLVKARSDGRLGPNLRQASGCSNEPSSKGPRCGFGEYGPDNPGISGQNDWVRFNFAGILSRYIGRHVVDRTGLSGEFALRVNFAYITPPLTTGAAPLPDGPSLFAALEEQLGLKLETATEPVEVLVIDSVSQPTPD